MSAPRQDVTLALDAATYRGSVAVVSGTRVLAERTVAMRGATEERLMPAVAAALADAGVAGRAVARVVCGDGPGSFTSLRIAASIAKGLAVAWSVPLLAVPSALLVALGGEAPPAPGRYLVSVDAMRGERFTAEVQVEDPDAPPRLGAQRLESAELAAARAAAEQWAIVGPDAVPGWWPEARAVARLEAWLATAVPVDARSWEPAYGRLPEAQVKWEAAHGRPLTAR